MTTLRIRTFTVLCLVLILLIPWLCFVAAHAIETKSLTITKKSTQYDIVHGHLTEMISLLDDTTMRWHDPSWQNQLNIQIEQVKQSLANEPAANRYTVQAIAAGIGVVIAFIMIGFMLRRLLLKPLEKLGVAARHIASGDLDITIPSLRIKEIAEVRDGFEAMVAGLRKAHQKQIELEEERRFVIAAIAHDLRTPLFALRGYLDGLAQGIARSPEQMTKYVAVCKEKSAQLDRLVEDLFTFSKMEYVDERLDSERVNVPSLLQKALDSVQPAAEQKTILFRYDRAPLDDCIVYGDEHLLERAFSNLLDNAVRHTPSGGTIAMECVQEGSKFKFSIHDSGDGFSEEELPKVFEPLYRGEHSRNRATGGSGLGLTISQRIVRKHGGDLEAGNHPQGGARLTGWLPAVNR